MDYKPKFIEGMSIEDINAELKRMAYEQWAYGRSIDRPRMWDLEYTKMELEELMKQEV